MHHPFRLLCRAALAGALLACLFLAGCAGNTVRLLYSPNEPGALPTASAKRLAVIMFDDQRSSQALGMRDNGTVFAASSSVADWVSRSLGDSVLKLGPQVSYAPTLAEAQRGKPDYIVTGAIHEVWLQETGTVSVNAIVRLTITMTNGKGMPVFTETQTSTQERKGVLTSNDVENLLVDTLRGISGPISRKINDAMR
jgi:uncharacterized lipoprotein YajG